jgi:hypothetical protein
MTTQAMITMFIFLGGIWGSFIFLLIRALRHDRATKDEAP